MSFTILDTQKAIIDGPDIASSTQVLTLDLSDPAVVDLKVTPGTVTVRLPRQAVRDAAPFLMEAKARDAGTRLGFKQELTEDDRESLEYDEADPGLDSQVILTGLTPQGNNGQIALNMIIAEGLGVAAPTL